MVRFFWAERRARVCVSNREGSPVQSSLVGGGGEELALPRWAAGEFSCLRAGVRDYDHRASVRSERTKGVSV